MLQNQQQQQAAQLLLGPGQTSAVGYLPITPVHQQLSGTANGLLAAQAAASSAQPASAVAALANAQAQALALQQMQQYGIATLPVSSNASIHNQLALAAQQHQGNR